jgi:hypothetical protein
MKNNKMTNAARAQGVNHPFLKQKRSLLKPLWSALFPKIWDFILEISDDDKQCKISVSTSGITQSAQPLRDPARDFLPDPFENAKIYQ